MKIICSQLALKQGLSIVSRAVPSRPTHPILGNILLVAKENTVTLTGFDLTLGIKHTFDAEIEDEGTITLPAKFFTDIINKLPEGEITIECEEFEENPMVEIQSKSGKFKLRGVMAEEYPQLPTNTGNDKFELPITPLLEGLRGTLFASANDETKQVLTGVHITAKDNLLEFASTDGHRLAVVKPVLEEQEITDFQITIPNKALREVQNAISGETVTLCCTDSQIIFETEKTTITTRSLDGAYPNYQQLIPTAFERTFVVDRKALIESVERVSIFADQKNNMVKVEIKEEEIIITADAKDLGNAKTTLPVETTGEPLTIGFNVKYLLEGLKAISSNEVKLSLNGAIHPVIITPLSGMQMTYLIMPVNIRE